MRRYPGIPMRIVVLDGYTLNPGDQSWDDLKSLGEVVYFDRTPVEETVSRCEGADAIITNKAPLTAEMLGQLPDLKYVGVTATGSNIVDVEACRRQGVTVCNVPAYSSGSVAQLVFAYILEHCHHVALHSSLVRDGRWAASKDFAFWETPLIELEGQTLGIVGFGGIGKRVAEIALAFGMRVLTFTRSPISHSAVTQVELDQLLGESDFITLHCPLTPQTQGLISAERIAKMKPSAFLINTGRGPLVVEQDLADALNEGRLAGAGLDVLSSEPPPTTNPLLSATNAMITPHIAWATQAARRRLMGVTVENVRQFAAGTPQNVVS